MGNSPSTQTDTTKHVFSASTPINFSPELISSLQSTPETNSSRAKTLDLHIQQRVAEELEKIQKSESERLRLAREKVVSEGESHGKDQTTNDADGTKSNVLGVTLPSASSVLPSSLTSTSSPEEQHSAQSSQKVRAEIDKLKTQLSQRKVLRDLPKGVENARNDVISCLRVNDRRPLDCWREVEVFKREVQKLEDEFVRKIL